MFGGGRGGMGGMNSSSNGTIVISGGDLYINASGDGIDANGSLKLAAAIQSLLVQRKVTQQPLTMIPLLPSTGGTFIGTGSANMAQTFSSSQQGVIALSVGNQTAGTNITLKDSNENILFDFSPELPYNVVILSSPDMISGETYTVTVGTSSSSFEAK